MERTREGRHHKTEIDTGEKTKESQKKYLNSDKGKEVTKRYLLSEKGKEAREKYLNSDKGKAAKLRYLLSEKGQKYAEKQNRKLGLAYQCTKWLKENPGKTPLDFFNLLTEEQKEDASNDDR